jgi:hypothetical protein
MPRERRFAFRLCLALGVLHPDHLLPSLSGLQFVEWMKYAAIEPFGPKADDIRLGGIQAALYNIHRDPAKHPRGFSSAEMYPWSAPMEQPAQLIEATADEQAAVFDRLFSRA